MNKLIFTYTPKSIKKHFVLIKKLLKIGDVDAYSQFNKRLIIIDFTDENYIKLFNILQNSKLDNYQKIYTSLN